MPVAVRQANNGEVILKSRLMQVGQKGIHAADRQIFASPKISDIFVFMNAFI